MSSSWEEDEVLPLPDTNIAPNAGPDEAPFSLAIDYGDEDEGDNDGTVIGLPGDVAAAEDVDDPDTDPGPHAELVRKFAKFRADVAEINNSTSEANDIQQKLFELLVRDTEETWHVPEDKLKENIDLLYKKLEYTVGFLDKVVKTTTHMYIFSLFDWVATAQSRLEVNPNAHLEPAPAFPRELPF